MLPLLTLLSAQADEATKAEPVADLDALISVSTTPVVRHPIIETELKTDNADVRKVLRENHGQLVYCYETSLKANPELSGRLTLSVTVNEGVVTSVDTPVNTLTDPQVSECITRKVQGWRFPAVFTSELTFPFTCSFEP